jgi:hypothetical protein
MQLRTGTVSSTEVDVAKRIELRKNTCFGLLATESGVPEAVGEQGEQDREQTWLKVLMSGDSQIRMWQCGRFNSC